MMKNLRNTGVGLTALFLSFGTLICCVLPLVLVTLGMGAVVASLITAFPLLVTLSQHKAWIFLTAALLLMITAWVLWRPNRSCPADPKLAALCNRLQRWNKRIFWAAFIIWLIGFSVTYMVLPFGLWIGL